MNKNGYFQSDKDGNVTKAPPKKQPPPFSGGVTSWNDLPDRPFGESVETVFPLAAVQITGDYKVSYSDVLPINYVPTEGAAVKIKITIPEYFPGEEYSYSGTWGIFNGDLTMMENGEPVPIIIGGDTQHPLVLQYIVSGDSEGLQLVWPGTNMSLSINVEVEMECITPIPTEYLPKALQFGYDKKTLTEILNKENVTLSTASAGISYGSLDVEYSIVDGQNYIVSYKGTDYNCTAADGAIGNVGKMSGNDTGEPFTIVTQSGTLYLYDWTGATSANVIVKTEISTPVLLGSEWVNPSSAVFNVTIAPNSDETAYTADKTFEEIRAAYYAGKAVFAAVKISEGTTLVEHSLPLIGVPNGSDFAATFRGISNIDDGNSPSIKMSVRQVTINGQNKVTVKELAFAMTIEE